MNKESEFVAYYFAEIYGEITAMIPLSEMLEKPKPNLLKLKQLIEFNLRMVFKTLKERATFTDDVETRNSLLDDAYQLERILDSFGRMSAEAMERFDVFYNPENCTDIVGTIKSAINI